MKKYLAFIGIGSFFATVEEFLTVAVLRRDFGSYLFTLFILFPVFLSFVYFSSRLIDRLTQDEPARELTHLLVFGFIGLMIEWFLIGLSPWSDPDANPFFMLVFQLGMFSFWATVGFAPRLFLNPRELSRRARRHILIYYVPYFIAAYFAALIAPESLKFIVIIPLILVGYLLLNLFYLLYFVRSFARNSAALA